MLQSFKDICENNCHVETAEENKMGYLYITSYLYNHKHILEKIEHLPNGLYITTISSIEANHVTGQNLVRSSTYFLCHDLLGHPSQDMMLCILKSSYGHPLSRKRWLKGPSL